LNAPIPSIIRLQLNGTESRATRGGGRSTKLDRLGCSTRELLNLIEAIGKAGAAFRSLGDPLWDTSSSQGRLLSTLLAAIAEFERELIRERTGEGRKRAMANGVKFGRKPKLSDYQRQ
jgi:DNA invertase Pin-like site-specific DNA recombinase